MKPLFSVWKTQPEERSGTFLRNIGAYLPENNTSQTREQQSTYLPENFTLYMQTLVLSSCNKFLKLHFLRCVCFQLFSPINTFHCLTVQYIGRKVSGFSECRAQFDPRPVHAGLVAYKVTMVWVFAVYLQRIRHVQFYAPDLRIIFEVVTQSLNKRRGSKDFYFLRFCLTSKGAVGSKNGQFNVFLAVRISLSFFFQAYNFPMVTYGRVFSSNQQQRSAQKRVALAQIQINLDTHTHTHVSVCARAHNAMDFQQVFIIAVRQSIGNFSKKKMPLCPYYFIAVYALFYDSIASRSVKTLEGERKCLPYHHKLCL